MAESIITRFRGDNASLALTCLHPDTGAVFNPTGCVLICTVKLNKTDADTAAKIQKISTVGGITIVDAGAGSVTVAFVPADMDQLSADAVYHYDLQAQNATTGAVYTVASGRLAPTADVTRGTTLAITTTTTNPAVGYTWANIADKPSTFPATGGASITTTVAAGASVTLTMPADARWVFAKVTPSGTGTATILLAATNAVDGAGLGLRLAMPALAGLTVEIRDGVSNTLLASVATDGTAGTVGFIFSRGATAWDEPTEAAWLD